MRRNRGMSLRLLMAAAAMGTVSMVAGCGGTNLFSVTGISGQAGGGTQALTVQILNPPSDSVLTVGDSVLVRAELTDATGVTSARMYGFAHRGVDSLGTGQDVPRFTEKDITFATAIADTTVVRYLVATSDTTQETVYLVVEASDSAGNVGADTVSVQVTAAGVVPDVWSNVHINDNALLPPSVRDSHGADRIPVSASRDNEPARAVGFRVMPAYPPYERGTPSRRGSRAWSTR
jgi:hypothetical protein